MRKLATAMVGACVLVSACGSGDKPRPAPVPSYVSSPVPVQEPTTLPPTPEVTREEPHTSRVPSPGPTREALPLPQPDNAMERETAPPPPPPPPPKPSPKPTVPKTTKPPPQPRPVVPMVAPSPRPTVLTGNVITIGAWAKNYTTAYKNQKAVDACKVVEWDTRWFVGHNYCGYAFWASLKVGDTVFLSGKNAGVYTVSHTVYLSYQGGKVPPGLPAFDLALQTCKGSGTQLVFAQKTG